MGTTAYAGKGAKRRAANGNRPPDAASRRREQQIQSDTPNPRLPPLLHGDKTKAKIARVSGAYPELPPRSLTLEITGGAEERRKAKKYAKCVMAQRVGDVVIDEMDPNFNDDCTIVHIPNKCAGVVTGTNGSFLRQVSPSERPRVRHEVGREAGRVRPWCRRTAHHSAVGLLRWSHTHFGTEGPSSAG